MGRGYRKLAILSILSVILVFSIGSISLPNVEAIKGQGVSLPKIGSSEICGDKPCVGPMTTQQKINQYLQSLEAKQNESTIDNELLEALVTEISELQQRRSGNHRIRRGRLRQRAVSSAEVSIYNKIAKYKPNYLKNHEIYRIIIMNIF